MTAVTVAASRQSRRRLQGAAKRRHRSLREWRMSLGLRQDEVASWLGLSAAWVSRTERNAARYPQQAARLREGLLAMARDRLERTRNSRRLAVDAGRVRRAWAALPEPARGRFTEAMCDLAWEYLDRGRSEEADVIGLLMPGETYQELLNAFFGETVEGDEAVADAMQPETKP